MKIEKITASICWSILMVGLGYSWAYYHFTKLAEANLIAFAAAKGLLL